MPSVITVDKATVPILTSFEAATFNFLWPFLNYTSKKPLFFLSWTALIFTWPNFKISNKVKNGNECHSSPFRRFINKNNIIKIYKQKK